MRENISVLEEKLKSEDLQTRREENERIKSEYENKISELEEQLSTALHSSSSQQASRSSQEASSVQNSSTSSPGQQDQILLNDIKSLQTEKQELETKLREKEWESSGLKVDMHQGEINFQRIKKKLQDELDYEKTRVSKLNSRIRSLESDRMEASFQAPAEPRGSRAARSSVSRSTNTNTADCASPEWGSGSGLIKEVRLYELEHKTTRLEKEMKREKEATDFYMKRGNDWKKHAKWYEEILDTHKIRYRKPYADKENQKPEAASRDSSSGSAASNNRQPLGKSEPDKVLGELAMGLGNLGLGGAAGAGAGGSSDDSPVDPKLIKMKKRAQEVLGVQQRAEHDPVLLQKERPPNDCPTQ